MANFPTSLPNISNPSSSNTLNSPAHATIHSNVNDEVTAVATKVGIDSSTPTANTFLKGTATGESNWSTIPVQGAVITDSDASTITFDLSTGNKHKVQITADRTLALSNVLTGHIFAIIIQQDGSGGHKVTWFSGIKWPGGVAPTLTTTASAFDVFTFIYDGTNYYGSVVGGLQ